MTLRARLALLTSAAVALAVLAASVAAWFLIRGTLMDEVDQRLQDAMPDLDRIAERNVRITTEDDVDGELPLTDDGKVARLFVQGDLIGVQQVEPDGSVRASWPPGDVEIALTPEEQQILDGQANGPLLRTEVVDGASYRVMSDVVGDGLFFRLVHPLDRVADTMTRMAWLLVGVAGFGVVAAGGTGWLIVRAGLRPVDRLTAAAEQVAATKDLAHRIETAGNGRDEVTRLAESVNTMLKALDEARTEQKHLVENAGHELRTPLATLRNDIGLLLRAEHHPDRTLDGADRADLLRALDSEATGLSTLVAELVDLARGEVEPEQPLETGMRALVERAVARTRRVNPEVDISVAGASFEATVRPVMLERAISNLVRNGVQASPDGATVDVDLRDDDGWAVIRVLDRGPGVADSDLPHIFDRFYRGHDARTRPGSGLGLAIVKQAADQHGGTVEAANRADGGAVFTLRVPVSPALSDPLRSQS